MAKWSCVYRPKDQGGLGIHDLEVKNIALLGKCLLKLLTEEGMRQADPKGKVCFLLCVVSYVLWKPGDSHFSGGSMATKKFFFPYGAFSIHDGSKIRFGRINGWVTPLSLNSIMLCTTLRTTKARCSLRCSKPPHQNVMFRQDLVGPLQHLTLVHLTQGKDEFRWNLHQSDLFSLDSMYKSLIKLHALVDNNRNIWKMNIPLKVNVFVWYLHRGVILTKENLAKQNWHGCKTCVFYHQDEIIKQLFLQCKFSRYICGQSSK
jgi:hypothetical protein